MTWALLLDTVIDTGMEVVFFAVQDPDFTFCSLEIKVDGLQQNEAPKFVFLQVFTFKANLKSKLILFTFIIETFLVLL